jgi:hypothetical protein
LIFYDEAGQYAQWVLIAVFASIGVLVSGVTILSLKSSAKHAPDPYTVSTEPSGSMRMRPHMPRGRSGTPGEGGESDVNGDDGSGPSKAAEEGRGRIVRSRSDRLGGGARDGDEDEREVMWEVGSISDSGDDDDGTGEGGEDRRKGIGGGDVRGERRGLLFDEEEEETGGPITPIARTTAAGLAEAERNPFADDQEGFGDLEAVPPGLSARPAGDQS